MKKVLFRKLLNDYLSFFFIALISTSLVIWVFQAVNYLDIMIEDGRDYLVYINYTLLNFPKIISKVFPFALFFSVFYVTTKSELNNELIIFWNFGVHKIKIINFIFKISLVLLILQIFLTAFLVPKCQDLARSFLRSSTINFLDNFIKPQKFNDTIKGVTIYSDNKDNSGNLTNLYLKKVINGDEFQITYAKRGMFKQIGETPVLVLNDGATITSKKGGLPETFENSLFINKINEKELFKGDFCFLNNDSSMCCPDNESSSSCVTPQTIKCLADNSAQIGDPLCCGQTGVVQNTKHNCPSEYPNCVGYKCGETWGKCTSDTSAQ